MVTSDGAISVELFILLLIVYVCVAAVCASVISNRQRELSSARADLRDCTELLVQAHRELKLNGSSDLCIEIERHMRKRLHAARAIEVTL